MATQRQGGTHQAQLLNCNICADYPHTAMLAAVRLRIFNKFSITLVFLYIEGLRVLFSFMQIRAMLSTGFIPLTGTYDTLRVQRQCR